MGVRYSLERMSVQKSLEFETDVELPDGAIILHTDSQGSWLDIWYLNPKVKVQIHDQLTRGDRGHPAGS